MDTYSLLRAFADSWFLIAMFCFVLGTWIFAFWPSLSSDRDAASRIPFKDDEEGCTGDCTNCACNTDFLKGLNNG